MREEATRPAKLLINSEVGMKFIYSNVMKDLLYMSVLQPQYKLDESQP